MFYLIATPRHPIVLGLSWLETHNPIVDWCNRSITFPVQLIPVSIHSLASIAADFGLVTIVVVLSRYISIPINNLPARYSNFFGYIREAQCRSVTGTSPYDCPIKIQADEHSPFAPIYGLAEPELEALCTYLANNLVKGFIQPSNSLARAPILCVDYRGVSTKLR